MPGLRGEERRLDHVDRCEPGRLDGPVEAVGPRAERLDAGGEGGGGRRPVEDADVGERRDEPAVVRGVGVEEIGGHAPSELRGAVGGQPDGDRVGAGRFYPARLPQRGDQRVHRRGAHAEVVVALAERGEQAVLVPRLLHQEAEQRQHERVVGGAEGHGVDGSVRIRVVVYE
jgi:hypothetical protein